MPLTDARNPATTRPLLRPTAARLRTFVPPIEVKLPPTYTRLPITRITCTGPFTSGFQAVGAPVASLMAARCMRVIVLRVPCDSSCVNDPPR